MSIWTEPHFFGWRVWLTLYDHWNKRLILTRILTSLYIKRPIVTRMQNSNIHIQYSIHLNSVKSTDNEWVLLGSDIYPLFHYLSCFLSFIYVICYMLFFRSSILSLYTHNMLELSLSLFLKGEKAEFLIDQIARIAQIVKDCSMIANDCFRFFHYRIMNSNCFSGYFWFSSLNRTTIIVSIGWESCCWVAK